MQFAYTLFFFFFFFHDAHLKMIITKICWSGHGIPFDSSWDMTQMKCQTVFFQGKINKMSANVDWGRLKDDRVYTKTDISLSLCMNTVKPENVQIKQAGQWKLSAISSSQHIFATHFQNFYISRGTAFPLRLHMPQQRLRLSYSSKSDQSLCRALCG